MTKINSLKELLVEELRDLYSAEVQLTKALPKMADAAEFPELKYGFAEHLEQTRGHVIRLEKALEELGEDPKGKTCKAMEGLIAEGKESISEKGPAPIRDANLIGSAQRVEHYEIAAYGTARTFAETLGLAGIADLLQETLDEEIETDRKLTEMARTVNEEALAVAN
jgi:ferritin-like metal-binding protein YciE